MPDGTTPNSPLNPATAASANSNFRPGIDIPGIASAPRDFRPGIDVPGIASAPRDGNAGQPAGSTATVPRVGDSAGNLAGPGYGGPSQDNFNTGKDTTPASQKQVAPSPKFYGNNDLAMNGGIAIEQSGGFHPDVGAAARAAVNGPNAKMVGSKGGHINDGETVQAQAGGEFKAVEKEGR